MRRARSVDGRLSTYNDKSSNGTSSFNQVLTHAARAAATQLNLWWQRAARAKGSGQSNGTSANYVCLGSPGFVVKTQQTLLTFG